MRRPARNVVLDTRKPVSTVPMRPFSVDLRSYPRGEPAPPPQILQTQMLVQTNAQRAFRQRFGRAINMDRIEVSLQQAYRGNMRDLTDISHETVDNDPHLASVLNKRFRAVSSLPWEVQPAEGAGVNADKAGFYAQVVRDQLRNMEGFRQFLLQQAWALFDGRAAHELRWIPVSAGQVSMAVESAGWIHPRRLSFGPQRQLQIVDEVFINIGGNFTPNGVDVRSVPYKFVWWMPQLFNEYPEREGLAQRVLAYSFFKRFGARERQILVELFGKPWRVLEVDNDSEADEEALLEADDILEGLGSSYSARIPRGTKLNITNPQRNAGQVHAEVIAECDRQMSKLVLGQTGTTDSAPMGFNSNQAGIMQDEQLMILQGDSRMLGDNVETRLTDAIIAVNFGVNELPHAPHFLLRSDLPVDRKQELERLKRALEAGLAIRVSEAYEVSGFNAPDPDEAVVRIEQPPMPPLAPTPPAPRPVVVYPPGTSPAAGEQQPPPPKAAPGPGAGPPDAQVGSSDAAATITVNEDRAARGLPPLTLPDGSTDPDGELTIEEFKTKRASASSEGEEELDETEEPEVDVADAVRRAIAAGARAPLPDSVQLKVVHRSDGRWEAKSEDGTRSFGVYDTEEQAKRRVQQVEYFKHQSGQLTTVAHVLLLGGASPEECERELRAADQGRRLQLSMQRYERTCVQCAAGHRQPDGPNGNVETLLERGLPEGRRAVARIVQAYQDAVRGKQTAGAILAALTSARAALDVRPLGRVLERRMVHSLALGALDGADDVGEESVEASSVRLQNGDDFSKKRYADAVKAFTAREVMSRATFDRLSAAAKQRAFTVAGVVGDQALGTIRDELVRQVAAGASLQDFDKAIEARMQSAGFTASLRELADGTKALSSSHTETVFRTNVLGAYNAGRANQMLENTSTRPVWEIRATLDGETRGPHRNAHGKRLLASDPFWQQAYPPFGYNCRCRVVSRKTMDGVISGSSLTGLPDPGFSSGISALLSTSI